MDPQIAAQTDGVEAEPLRAFAVVLRGYDRYQVDEQLRQVDAEMRQHREQVHALQQELNEANRQLREREQLTYAGLSSRIERLLQLAEERATEIVAEARSTANELQAAAKVDAAELRAAAEREADAIRTGARRESDELTSTTEREVAELRAMADHEVAEKRAAVERDRDAVERDMARLRTTAEREAASRREESEHQEAERLSAAQAAAQPTRGDGQPSSGAPARGPVRPTLDIARPTSMIPVVPVVGERVSAAVDMFRDRVTLRAQLRDLILAREKPIICVTGPRGIGKSGLVAKVLADFEEAADMAEGQVGGLAYLSTRTGVGVLDLPRVFHALTRLLPPDQGDRLEAEWADAGADALPDLLTALRARNAVLLLDNLDDLQDPDSGELTHEGLITFLSAICQAPEPPVIITTSQRPIRLPPEMPGDFAILEIDDGLEGTEAIEFLRQLDVDNRAGLRDLPDAQLLAGVELVYRVPRGLELLFALIERRSIDTLRRLFHVQDAPEALLERLVSTAFQSLDEVERDVVRVLALADTPLPADAIPAMVEDQHPADKVTQVIERLAETRMIGFEFNTGRARLHPIDSDYVRGTLVADRDEGDELDLRLADWLASQRTDPVTWRTSSDVDPQRREIRHRLRAGDGHGALRVIADIAEFLSRHGDAEQLTDVLEEARRYAGTPAVPEAEDA